MKLLRIITVFGALIALAGCELEDSDSNESKIEVLPEVIFTMPEENSTEIDIYSKVLIATNSEFNLENVQLLVKIHNKNLELDVEGEFLVEGTNIIFTPTLSLEFNTVYEILIDSQLNDISGKSLSEEEVIAFTTEVDPLIKAYDGVFPELLFSYPKAGDNSIKINSSINLALNSPVFMNDVQQFIIVKNKDSNTAVSGEFTLVNNVVTFQPENDFYFDTNYEITISSDLSNIAGNSFVSDEVISFQSEGIPLNPAIGSWSCTSDGGRSGFLVFEENGRFSESGVDVFNGIASAWTQAAEDIYIITGNGTNQVTITFSNSNENMRLVPDRDYMDKVNCVRS